MLSRSLTPKEPDAEPLLANGDHDHDDDDHNRDERHVVFALSDSDDDLPDTSAILKNHAAAQKDKGKQKAKCRPSDDDVCSPVTPYVAYTLTLHIGTDRHHAGGRK